MTTADLPTRIRRIHHILANNGLVETERVIECLSDAATALANPQAAQPEGRETAGICMPNGLWFDAFGEPRTRYVRVSLDGSHCVMHPSEGDTYLDEAKANDDDSEYVVADVYLSEREFDDLGEFDGF